MSANRAKSETHFVENHPLRQRKVKGKLIAFPFFISLCFLIGIFDLTSLIISIPKGMHTKKAVSLFAILFMLSCTQNNIVLERWENGSVKRERTSSSNTAYSEKIYHENGQLRSETQYHDGKRNGKGTAYYSNGKVLGTVTYINDTVNGPCIEYYPNGNLRFEGVQEMGKLIGTVKRYHPNGLVNKEEMYINGVRALQHEWDSLGNKTK
jgi:hypothetical protein